MEGVDIDKLASMLAKVNLYIQALDWIKEGHKYKPGIQNRDFFELPLEPGYAYVATNPPYTRQEEMTMAYYDSRYKERLRRAVSDIGDWSEKSSIYAYFLVRAGKLLRAGGRLGFIVENSWLNAEYGKALKRWLFGNFGVEYVVESLVERWFEDAAIITNIIVAEKAKGSGATRFVFLKRPIRDLIGEPPPATDYTANERYYKGVMKIYEEADGCEPREGGYSICESDNMRVVAASRDLISLLDERMGRLGVLRGPREYLDLVFRHMRGDKDRVVLLGDVLRMKWGLKTNANEIFYLPSKYWAYMGDDGVYLALRGPLGALRMDKRYLRRLIRLAHLKDAPYRISEIPLLKREDYVLWVEDKTTVRDPGTLRYIEWAERMIREEHGTDKRFPTLHASLSSSPSTWLRLPDTSGGTLIFRSAINKNYSVWLNTVEGAQVDHRIYAGYPRDEYRGRVSPETMFAVANSVLAYLGMELMGGANLGMGALDMKTVDYEVVPIVNPAWLEDHLKERGIFEEFLSAVRAMLELKPADIEVEARRPERMAVEKYVLGPLGFSEGAVRRLYDELIRLVRFRTERAKNIGLQ